MSTTALVRSSSSTSNLVRSPSSTNNLVRTSSLTNNLVSSPAQPKAPSPSATFTGLLPKLSQTPQSKGTPSRTPTPQQQQQQPSPATSTPGRWQHPRMDEVIRRQARTNFDQSNTRLIIYNTGVIATSFFIPSILHALLPTPWLQAIHPYPTYTLHLLRALLLLNIILALTPLFLKTDTCEDIPLTPAQRQLLGLPPMSRPATPQEKEQYVTPPRYSRSGTGTPWSASSSLRAEISSSSPLGAKGTPMSPFGSGQQQQRRTGSGSPYAASSGLRSAGGAEKRRLSYTSTARSSPMSFSEFDAAGGSIGTPTKAPHRASVGLNSKWLYEKGRASPNAWGGGSVFS